MEGRNILLVSQMVNANRVDHDRNDEAVFVFGRRTVDGRCLRSTRVWNRAMSGVCRSCCLCKCHIRHQETFGIWDL
jgi:hypothetical protein